MIISNLNSHFFKFRIAVQLSSFSHGGSLETASKAEKDMSYYSESPCAYRFDVVPDQCQPAST
jgi:hypothetical protein